MLWDVAIILVCCAGCVSVVCSRGGRLFASSLSLTQAASSLTRASIFIRLCAPHVSKLSLFTGPLWRWHMPVHFFFEKTVYSTRDEIIIGLKGASKSSVGLDLCRMLLECNQAAGKPISSAYVGTTADGSARYVFSSCFCFPPFLAQVTSPLTSTTLSSPRRHAVLKSNPNPTTTTTTTKKGGGGRGSERHQRTRRSKGWALVWIASAS